MNSAQNSRFLTIGILFSIIGVMIFGQMVNIQNRPDIKDLQAKIEQNNNSITLKVVPERGAIFDRNGKLLAGSKEVYEIGIDLKIINEKTSEQETEAIARAVATVTGQDYNRMLELTRADRNTFLYMRLADGVDPVDQLRQIKQAMLDEGKNLMRALVLVPHLQRSYPEKSTAANVLGYVKSLDPKNPIGVNGVEGHYNSYLAGITTVVTGQCGLSPAPLGAGDCRQTSSLFGSRLNRIGEAMPWSKCASLDGYLEFLNQIGLSVNVAPLVGQGVIRAAVMGFDPGQPDAGQRAAIRRLAEEAMDQGAFGISTGLIYPPGMYAARTELVELG